MGFGSQTVQRNVKQQELEFRNKLMSPTRDKKKKKKKKRK
jgi:hypothetical protein